jgi:hypothetical protein
MIEFIKMLLFAKSVLLTPEPINIEVGRLDIQLKEPISAVTTGAALYIDVYSMLPIDSRGIHSARSWLSQEVCEGCIQAILHEQFGTEEVTLRFDGSSSWGDGRFFLILSADEGIPLKTKYHKIVLETEVGLEGVVMVWRNHRK